VDVGGGVAAVGGEVLKPYPVGQTLRSNDIPDEQQG
jgi:hypothetical protein